LWQRIQVEAGWETAVEAVLRERLHALELESPEHLQSLLGDVPVARVTAYAAVDAHGDIPDNGLTALARKVSCPDPPFAGIVHAWLDGHYAVDNIPALEARLTLEPQ